MCSILHLFSVSATVTKPWGGNTWLKVESPLLLQSITLLNCNYDGRPKYLAFSQLPYLFLPQEVLLDAAVDSFPAVKGYQWDCKMAKVRAECTFTV